MHNNTKTTTFCKVSHMRNNTKTTTFSAKKVTHAQQH